MIETATTIAAVLLFGCIALGLWRLLLGPTVLDRLLALDAVLFFGVGLLCISSIRQETRVFLELIIVVALLGFFTMVAFFYYLHRVTSGSPEYGREREDCR